MFPKLTWSACMHTHESTLLRLSNTFSRARARCLVALFFFLFILSFLFHWNDDTQPTTQKCVRHYIRKLNWNNVSKQPMTTTNAGVRTRQKKELLRRRERERKRREMRQQTQILIRAIADSNVTINNVILSSDSQNFIENSLCSR